MKLHALGTQFTSGCLYKYIQYKWYTFATVHVHDLHAGHYSTVHCGNPTCQCWNIQDHVAHNSTMWDNTSTIVATFSTNQLLHDDHMAFSWMTDKHYQAKIEMHKQRVIMQNIDDLSSIHGNNKT